MDFWERLEWEIGRRSSRKEIAALAGVATSTFSAWKARKTYPDGDVLVRIAKALDLSVEYLVLGTDLGDQWVRDHAELIADLKQLNNLQLASIESTVKGLLPKRQPPSIEKFKESLKDYLRNRDKYSEIEQATLDERVKALGVTLDRESESRESNKVETDETSY